jgi:hypothetical protein
MSVRIEKGQGDFLIISFDYSYEKVSAIKKIDGHRWDPIKKEWTIPISRKALEAISVAFCDDDIIFDSSVDIFDI